MAIPAGNIDIVGSYARAMRVGAPVIAGRLFDTFCRYGTPACFVAGRALASAIDAQLQWTKATLGSFSRSQQWGEPWTSRFEM
jgi:hypothetical protein